jgi:hypothetical protein
MEVWVVFLFLLVLYTAGSAGIVCSNDGSHYALVRSLGDVGSCRIDDYVHYTGFLDVAHFRGHWFSDRPPGTALLALPFYLLGKAAAALRLGHHITLPITAVLLMPAACGALAAVLCARLSTQLGAERRAGLLGALILGLGTTNWRYGTALFHHAPSAVLVVAAYVLALRKPPRLAFAGACAGAAMAVDYSNIVLAGWLLILAFTARRRPLLKAASFLAGLVPPLAVLAAYHWLCFGSPFASSYTHQYRFSWSTSVVTALGEPWWSQLPGVLWHLPGGLLILSPVIVLAPAGWYRIARREWRHGLTLAGAFLSLLIAVSSHRTPLGGGTIDARYLSAGLPLAVAAVALWIGRVFRCRTASFPPPAGFLVIALLVGMSVLSQLVSVSTFFGHALHELPRELLSEHLGGTAAATQWSPLVRTFAAALFPGTARIPAALLFGGACLAAAAIHVRLTHRPTIRQVNRGTSVENR